MKKVEIITPNGHLTEVHAVLRDMNVRGMSHYPIEGAGRIKAEPVVESTHPTAMPEYIMRHKVEVVVRDTQVEPLIKKIEEKFRDDPQGGKIFVMDVPLAVDISSDARGESAI
ncbi:MAG: P-II family nitrogen regulator [Nitrososphaera sp.]|jgi:nitrogen regulatory protein PII